MITQGLFLQATQQAADFYTMLSGTLRHLRIDQQHGYSSPHHGLCIVQGGLKLVFWKTAAIGLTMGQIGNIHLASLMVKYVWSRSPVIPRHVRAAYESYVNSGNSYFLLIRVMQIPVGINYLVKKHYLRVFKHHILAFCWRHMWMPLKWYKSFNMRLILLLSFNEKTMYCSLYW